MLPVLAQLGPVTLHTFPVLINLGLAAALAWLYAAAPPDRRSRWLDAGIAATVGGLIGARLVYVLVNGSYYAAHLEEAPAVWLGGLAWPGAAAGGLLGAGWYSRRLREPLLPILDALAVPLALLGLLGWGGCLAAGCAYGAEVTPGQIPDWMVSTAPDLYGLSVPRWPTQAAGIAWSVVAVTLVAVNRARRWPAGALGLYALSLAALGAFFISFLRGDPAPSIAGFRIDVVGSAVVLVATTLAWGFLLVRHQARSPVASHQ
jgi:phosphatidylglycerol:prolipoprotein diacylglycerol transferase